MLAAQTLSSGAVAVLSWNRWRQSQIKSSSACLPRAGRPIATDSSTPLTYMSELEHRYSRLWTRYRKHADCQTHG